MLKSIAKSSENIGIEFNVLYQIMKQKVKQKRPWGDIMGQLAAYGVPGSTESYISHHIRAD